MMLNTRERTIKTEISNTDYVPGTPLDSIVHTQQSITDTPSAIIEEVERRWALRSS